MLILRSPNPLYKLVFYHVIKQKTSHTYTCGKRKVTKKKQKKKKIMPNLTKITRKHSKVYKSLLKHTVNYNKL